MNLTINVIEKIVLLGGGKLLLSLANFYRSKGTLISVVTSTRHASEIFESGLTLSGELDLLSVPYLITSDIGSKDSKEFLGDLSNAFCLSMGAAWIFKEEIITEVFKEKLFNLHGTRLPQNRGGGGFSWQIMMGNRLGFCQLHLIDSGLDTGNLVKTKEFLYPVGCRTPFDYEKVYNEKNLMFLIDFIEEIKQSGMKIQTTKQTEYFSSYWPRLNASENGWIDWSDNIFSLERFVCAFDEPYEGSKTFLNGNKVFVKSVMSDFADQSFHKFQSGIIFRTSPSWISVCADGGTLIIQQVLNEVGESIINDIRVGDRFVTPNSYLEDRFKRIVYTPLGKK